jgi:hypothetical protein
MRQPSYCSESNLYLRSARKPADPQFVSITKTLSFHLFSAARLGPGYWPKNGRTKPKTSCTGWGGQKDGVRKMHQARRPGIFLPPFF